MRKLIFLAPLLLLGCSQQSPEEAEAAKYSPPKMMTEEEGKAFMAGQKDPRNGGGVPAPPPTDPKR